MKAVRGQFAFLMCAASAFAVVVSGCAVGGKSFYMDSNSRVPFFGLELKERKKPPAYNSISRSAADKSRVEAAVGVGASTSVELLKKGDGRVANARISGGVENLSDLVSASQRGSKSQPVQSIPLPRTDDPTSAPDRHAAPAVIDFQ